MRTLVLAVLSLLPTSLLAEEPTAIIEKAVAAHGGKERLAKVQALKMKGTGNINIGFDVPFTWDTVWQAPNQISNFVDLDKTISFTQGYDGKDAWAKANGVVVGLDAKKLDVLKDQMHLRRALMLIPLLDKSIDLEAAEDVKIGDKSAAGVKVSAKGEKEITLYFDKETGRVARVDHFVFEDKTMKFLLQEDVLSDYRNVDGVQTAFKEVWSRGGKQVAVLNYSEVTYPAKIEAREFARPVMDVPVGIAAARTRDVIYGRKLGLAMTMDVFTPEKANGAAVIFVVSGGWVSDNQPMNDRLLGPFVSEPLKRGYTVFAVFHGSQPKFTIPEAVADLNRAVRFIRANAAEYKIVSSRIGITGGSAGGHLSLMQGTAGDAGDPNAADPVDRESSRVQAVACLFPPTDFLNYGGEKKYAFGTGELLFAFRPVVDVRTMDPKTLRLERSEDQKQQLELAEKISPITHVTSDDPPTLIVHGDADKLVPIQQAELIIAKLKKAGVSGELITRPKRGHDLNGIEKDVADMTDWFDKYLKSEPRP